MKPNTAALVLCAALFAATSSPSLVSAQGWGGRGCSYKGAWANHGEELVGDTKRCWCDNGSWVNCKVLRDGPYNSGKPSGGYNPGGGYNSGKPSGGYNPSGGYGNGKPSGGYNPSGGYGNSGNRGPQGCTWGGRTYGHNEWRDDKCQCAAGSWKCTPAPNPPPAERGCADNFSLPFGLGNCICDGAEVGEAAGLAACARVASECLDFAAFSTEGALEAVQRVCDSLALDGCVASAQAVPFDNPGCAELLQFGTSKCSSQQANDIFASSVQFSCDPLCKDCVRRG